MWQRQTHTQDCHYLLDVKFKDFSMTFQYLFKEIQDLLYQLKPESFTYFFSKQTLLLGFTELADPDNEKQPMTGHFGQKSGLAKSQFLFFSGVESKLF